MMLLTAKVNDQLRFRNPKQSSKGYQKTFGETPTPILTNSQIANKESILSQ